MRSLPTSQDVPCSTGAQYDDPVGSLDSASDAKQNSEELVAQKKTVWTQDFVKTLPQHPWPSGSSSQDIAQELWAQRLELASQRDEIQSLRLTLDLQHQELQKQRSLAKEQYELVAARSKELGVGASNLRAALVGDLEQRLQGTLRDEIHKAIASFESVQREVVSRALEREGAVLEGALKDAISNAIKMHRSAWGQQRAETMHAAIECMAEELAPQLGKDMGQFHAASSKSGYGTLAKEPVTHKVPCWSTVQDLEEGSHTGGESGSDGIIKRPSGGRLASGVLDAIWALPEPRKTTLPDR